MVKTLEIGCGKHRSNVDVAIDINRNTALDVLADAHMLPFRYDTFELVYMLEVLEHVENPTKVLQEIFNVLKKNGKLILSFPNVYYFRVIIRWVVKGKKSSVSPEHRSAWSMAEIENLLKVTNFAIKSVSFIDYPRFNKPSLLASFLPRITKHSVWIEAEKI